MPESVNLPRKAYKAPGKLRCEVWVSRGWHSGQCENPAKSYEPLWTWSGHSLNSVDDRVVRFRWGWVCGVHNHTAAVHDNTVRYQLGKLNREESLRFERESHARAQRVYTARDKVIETAKAAVAAARVFSENANMASLELFAAVEELEEAEAVTVTPARYVTANDLGLTWRKRG